MTDTKWETLRPLLPPQKAWTGKPAKDHGEVREGIGVGAAQGIPVA